MTMRREFVEDNRRNDQEQVLLRLPVPRQEERYGTKDLLSSAIGDYLFSIGLLRESRANRTN